MSENNHIPAPHQVTLEVGGRNLILETGKIAKQANGAVTARYGDTVVLVTACMSTKPNRPRFSAPDRGLPGKHLFRGKDSGRFLQERRPANGARNSGFTTD